MKIDLQQILDSTPREIPWSEIIEFEQFDERMSGVGVLFANTIGVCQDYVEFCPDFEHPKEQEILSWIWSYRPDLADQILNKEISEDFRKLILCYKEDKMNEFWDYIS